MRFGSILLAGLTMVTTSVVADKLVAVEGCDVDLFIACGLYYAQWYTDFGVYDIDAHDGCRGTSVPGMTEICVDWGRGRGHFKFSHQDFKRCFVRGGTTHFTGDGCWGVECWRSEWNEAPCTWREIPGGDTDATVSVSELPGNGTEATAAVPTATTSAPITTGTPGAK
jgi:hypothetical protein